MGLRIVSANLCHGRADAAALADLVRRVEPDIVACQELLANQARVIEGLLPHGKLEPAVEPRDHNGMGIALRRPGIVDQIPLPGRPARRARLHPNDWPELEAPVEIVNVHVTAPHLWPPWDALWWRRGQARRLSAYVAEVTGPLALVGDFNSTPVWPAYRRLLRGLEDGALQEARARDAHPAPTWGPGAGTPRMLRIDHLLVQRVHVDAVEIHPLPGSDHSAIVASLRPMST